jgi:hypothetical protein
MWMPMLDPFILCWVHLNAAHMEIHSFRHVFERGWSIEGRVVPGMVQIEPRAMGWYHDALAEEMLRRGMKHKSPYEMPDLSYLPNEHRDARVDRAEALKLMAWRCPGCRERIRDFGFWFPVWNKNTNFYAMFCGDEL